MAQTKEKQQGGELVETLTQLPAVSGLNTMFEQDSGKGFENTTADDFAIPYLSIAQPGSPQLKKQDGKYIAGLEMGNLFDTVEGKRYEAVRVIPCYRERFFVEWVPKKSGGGFVARHPVSSNLFTTTTQDAETGKDVLPNGNELIDTTYLYALVIGQDGVNRAVVISFARTSMKKYKKLMSIARNLRIQGKNGVFNPPLYSHVYGLKTVLETSKKSGDDYYNWEVDGDPLMVTEAQLQEAMSLYKAVSTGARGAGVDPDSTMEKATDAF